jgi:hypothetical protein
VNFRLVQIRLETDADGFHLVTIAYGSGRALLFFSSLVRQSDFPRSGPRTDSSNKSIPELLSSRLFSAGELPAFPDAFLSTHFPTYYPLARPYKALSFEEGPCWSRHLLWILRDHVGVWVKSKRNAPSGSGGMNIQSRRSPYLPGKAGPTYPNGESRADISPTRGRVRPRFSIDSKPSIQ